MYIYIDAMHMVPADSAAGKKFIADQKKKNAPKQVVKPKVNSKKVSEEPDTEG